MQRNIGYLDRAIRFGVAMACAAFAFGRETRDVWYGVALGIGALALSSALLSYSVLYALLGISTREKRSPEDSRS